MIIIIITIREGEKCPHCGSKQEGRNLILQCCKAEPPTVEKAQCQPLIKCMTLNRWLFFFLVYEVLGFLTCETISMSLSSSNILTPGSRVPGSWLWRTWLPVFGIKEGTIDDREEGEASVAGCGLRLSQGALSVEGGGAGIDQLRANPPHGMSSWVLLRSR